MLSRFWYGRQPILHGLHSLMWPYAYCACNHCDSYSHECTHRTIISIYYYHTHALFMHKKSQVSFRREPRSKLRPQCCQSNIFYHKITALCVYWNRIILSNYYGPVNSTKPSWCLNNFNYLLRNFLLIVVQVFVIFILNINNN